MRQALECLNEADRCDQVQQRDQIHAHYLSSALPAAGSAFGSFFLNISSILCVTRKPPNTLTAASATASVPITLPTEPSVRPAASIAPTIMIAEMALVTAISG